MYIGALTQTIAAYLQSRRLSSLEMLESLRNQKLNSDDGKDNGSEVLKNVTNLYEKYDVSHPGNGGGGTQRTAVFSPCSRRVVTGSMEPGRSPSDGRAGAIRHEEFEVGAVLFVWVGLRYNNGCGLADWTRWKDGSETSKTFVHQAAPYLQNA